MSAPQALNLRVLLKADMPRHVPTRIIQHFSIAIEAISFCQLYTAKDWLVVGARHAALVRFYNDTGDICIYIYEFYCIK